MTDEIKKSIKENGAIRNPFYNKLNKDVVVPLGTEVYSFYSELAETNGEDIAALLRRCLTCYADELKEHESPMVILQ
jgi:hypothetical protein